MEELRTLLHVLHFTHFLWNGFLSAAMKDSAGNTDVLHAGHFGDVGGAVHPILGVLAVLAKQILGYGYLLSVRQISYLGFD